MQKALSLISRIHEKGNKFIIDSLNQNGLTGLVPSHGDILAVLYGSGKLTMQDIAKKIHRTKPTITVLVDKLEKLGFVKREKSSKDNRITYIVLTDKGLEFKVLFDEISINLNKMLYKNLSDDESLLIDKLLEKMSSDSKTD